MSYRVIVTDYLLPALVGQAGSHYESPPHEDRDARALARLLLGQSALPDGPGPWQRALPGGRRTVWLQPIDPS